MAINVLAVGQCPGLFTRVEALQAGLTDHDLRNPEYCRVIHGVYRTSETILTHELRCRAVAMKLPPGAVITGKSAATLHGVPLARPQDPVEVLVKGCKRLHGIRCWAVRHYEFESIEWSGVRLATLERAALDILMRNSLPQAVGLCDMLLHAGVIDKDTIGRYLEGRHDYGIRRARRAFEFLDHRAESPPESVLRVMFVMAGLNPVPQLEIPGENGSLLRADLGFDEARVLVEYDGAWHADPEQFRRDQQRLRWLRANGWHVIVVTAEDLAKAPQRIVDAVQAAVRRRPDFA
ncbi:DUF559 domain-containing protein [Saccharopolyspora shandongensis]|uniref:Transcriptional regulator, AbiEi antitoxin, Type IV TA system n=1 Tax=Saccharopolyspora shandongensis TaxID=418495 RepID=A0A1H3BXI9_9PSEU|nr:DUF559 domain-containing protein [Saccharopolyspora shandongensis]SDX46652.1 Transcriptional regulator, AbiEi antitoxin, Type IV TA system [Saccharopolyspora shandongensis]